MTVSEVWRNCELIALMLIQYYLAQELLFLLLGSGIVIPIP
jgi:hypothetical protein